MVKAADLREKSMDELREEETKLSQELFKYKMELATGQLTNTQALKETKRDLARVKTVIRQMQLNTTKE